jgi:flagellar hook-associated protein 2
MGSINLINGGLDVLGIVDGLINAERVPIQRLQAQAKTFQDKITAYQALNSRLLAFKTSVESLLFQGEDVPLSMPSEYSDRLSKSLFALRKAASSNEDVVTATAGKGTAIGNFAVTVSQLAKYHSFASNNFLSDTSTLTKTGTLVIQKAGETEVTITVDETNNNLQGIKSAINSQNAGFTATILNDGSGTPYRLVITSDDSGTANGLTITNNLTEGAGDAVTLLETTPAEDAELQINGVSITSSSNTVSDAIEGITFELRAESGTAAVRVERDDDAIVAGLKDLVAKYNDVSSYISSQSRYDATKKTAGILAGDFTLRAAQTDLMSIVNQSIDASGYTLSVLSQVGIKLTNNGTLSLDESVLRDKLSSDFNDTAHLFLGDGLNGEGSTTSIVPALQSRLKSLTDTIDGPVFHASDAMQQNISRLNKQIEQMESRLEIRREVLTAQFSKADAALRQLSVLQASLDGLVNSLSSL